MSITLVWSFAVASAMHVDGDDGAWHEEHELQWEGDEWGMDLEGPGPAMATPITPLAGLASSSGAGSCVVYCTYLSMY
jgi:hypothetical protein